MPLLWLPSRGDIGPSWRRPFVMLVGVACLIAVTSAFPSPPGIDRRAVLRGAVGGIAAAAHLPAAIAEPSSIFAGRYTDPNHPGGFREVSVLPGKVGSYQLAKIEGGGGRGEPESYTLPAVIIERADRQQIIIDFSAPPKNGPRDFAGQWEQSGIRFLRDGNFWPKQ